MRLTRLSKQQPLGWTLKLTARRLNEDEIKSKGSSGLKHKQQFHFLQVVPPAALCSQWRGRRLLMTANSRWKNGGRRDCAKQTNMTRAMETETEKSDPVSGERRKRLN